MTTDLDILHCVLISPECTTLSDLEKLRVLKRTLLPTLLPVNSSHHALAIPPCRIRYRANIEQRAFSTLTASIPGKIFALQTAFTRDDQPVLPSIRSSVLHLTLTLAPMQQA